MLVYCLHNYCAVLTSGNLFSLGSEWRSCDTRRKDNYAKQLSVARWTGSATQYIGNAVYFAFFGVCWNIIN